jgi:hypothetical protein
MGLLIGSEKNVSGNKNKNKNKSGSRFFLKGVNVPNVSLSQISRLRRLALLNLWFKMLLSPTFFLAPFPSLWILHIFL